MKWPNLGVAILVSALVTANLQCSAMCASAPYDNSNIASQSSRNTELPPCHGHSLPKNTPAGCSHSLFVAEAGSLAKTQAAQTFAAGFVSPQIIDTPFPPLPHKVVVQETPPPLSPEPTFFAVLQI